MLDYKVQWTNSKRTLVDVEKILFLEKDLGYVFEEITNLSLKEENEIIQLKEIIVRKVNLILTQPDVEKEKKLICQKFLENFSISFEIYIRSKDNSSSFNIILKSNLLEKLEMLINSNADDVFSFINQQFHEYYIDLIEWFIIKNNLPAIKKIFISRKNMEMIKNKKFIPIIKETLFIFEESGNRKPQSSNNLLENNTEYDTLNYIINLLIYLDSNNYSGDTIRSIIQQCDYIEKNVLFIEYLFDIYLNLKENLILNFTFKKFINSDFIELFNQEALSDLTKNENKYSKFCNEICVLSKNISENISFCDAFFEGEMNKSNQLKIFMRKLKKITLLPILLLIEIINGNTSIVAKNIFIKQFNTISLRYSNVTFKQLICYLIENISSTSNINMIIEILEQNSNCLKNFNVLKDLVNIKELLEILSKYNIKYNLMDILKVDILIKNKGLSFFKSSHFDILSSCITKLIRDRKTEIFTKILDQNLKTVDVFSKFLSKYELRFNELFIEYISTQKLYKAVPQLLMNEYYRVWKNASSTDIYNFYKILFNNKESIDDIDKDDIIKNSLKFLEEYNDLETTIQIKIRNFIKYLKILKVFSDNTLEEDLLKDYTVDNTNFLEIIEIYILKKFTIDEIISLDDFFGKCEDIYKALEYQQEEFLYSLFLIFSKYGNVKLCSEIMIRLNNWPKFFEKCHSHLLRLSNKNFANEILNDSNIGLSLIEKIDNSKMILSNITSVDFTNVKYKNQDYDIETLDIIGLYDFYERIKGTRNDLKNIIYNKEYAVLNIVKFFEFYDKNHVQKNLINPEDNNYKEVIQKSFFEFIENFNGNISSFTVKKVTSKGKMKSSSNDILLKFLNEIEIKIDPQIFVKNPLYKYKIFKRLIEKNKIELDEIYKIESFGSEKFKVHEDNLVELIFLTSMIFKRKFQSKFDRLIQIIRDKSKTFNISITNVIVSVITQILVKTHTFTIEQYLLINQIFPENKLYFTDDLLNMYSPENLEFIFFKIDDCTKSRFNIISFLAYPLDIYEEIKNLYNDFQINIKFNTTNERKIWQKIEIFRKINLNNFLVFREINNILNLDSKDHSTNEMGIDILFLQRILTYSINLSCHEAIDSTDLSDILDFINSRRFNKDHFKLIFLTILELNQIKFVIDSFENIGVFNNTIMKSITRIVSFKLKLFEEFTKHFNIFLDENPYYLEKFKVLKTKKLIIDSLNEDNFQEIYETLIKKETFSDILDFITKVEELNTKAFLDNIKKTYNS